MVITKDYQKVTLPDALSDTIRETDSYDNKSQVDDFDTIHSIVHDGQSNNNNNDVYTPFSDDDQYLHKTVKTILSPQPSLTVLIHEDILHHLHNDTSTVVHVQLSLLVSLRNGIIQSSLLTSLPSLLVSLRNGVFQSSLLVSLRRNSVLASPLMFLWNIFLRRLYEDISTIIRIKVKPETHSYNHLYEDISTVTPIHMRPEITRLWIPSRSLLQPHIQEVLPQSYYILYD